jgi:hypothetical protein
MKPFDTKGEYTPDEVKAALAGINGTRQLSFRYERLDDHNSFLDNIDYVQSCTIENNALADIKRTAKLDILDTGTINYLRDRIKPYIRLAMPADQTYADVVQSFDPDIWWKLDDPSVLQNIYNSVTIADGVNYQTSDVPYFGTTGSGDAYTIKTQTDAPGVLRSEAWIAYEITTSEALAFTFTGKPSTSTAGGNTFYILTAPDLTSIPVETGYTTSIGGNGVSTNTVMMTPKKGYVFVRLVSTAVGGYAALEVSAEKRTRIEDSSSNKIQGFAVDYLMGQPPLVGGGTSAKMRTGGTLSQPNRISSDYMMQLKHQDAYVVNLWASIDKPFLDVGEYSGKITIYTSNISEWYQYIEIQPTLSSDPNATFVIWQNGYYAEMLVPKAKVTGKHMYTFVYEPNLDKMQLFIDGVFYDNYVDVALDPLSVGVQDFHENNIQLIEVEAYAAVGNVYFDDISIFTRPVPETTISALYARGLQSGTALKRSGYVEWPQGVFVLSSPTRTMQDGNTVVRSVEGYDQLVVLKEDSYDYRYSVKKGAKYTDAVRTILQSTERPTSLPLTDGMWNLDTGTTVLTSSAAMFSPTATYSSAGMFTPYKITIGGSTMQARITIAPEGQFQFHIMPNSGSLQNGFSYNYDGTLSAVINGKVYATATYNATTHKYWRVREVAGFMYCDYSSDGNTWVNMGNAPTGYAPESPTRIFITGSTMGTYPASVQMRVDDFSLTIPRKVTEAIVSSNTVLPTGMEWEPGTPKLTIVNDLLAAINYESATYNEDGIFVGRPYVSPQNRTAAFRYATDSESVITGDIDQSVDLFGVPNKWVVVVSDPDRPALIGTYTNTDPLSPTSTVSRGRTIVDYRTEQSAADQLTLDAQAARLAFEASQVYESIEFDTALMPIHQNADVFEVEVDGLAVDSKFSEQSWSMSLKNGATMSHKVRKVVSV